MKRMNGERTLDRVEEVHHQPSNQRPRTIVSVTWMAAALFLGGQGVGCSASKDQASAVVSSELTVDMDQEYERFNAQLPRLIAIQDRFEPGLLADKGVSSIGIGLAEDGVTPVFRVVVSNPDLLKTLPRTVEGVPVEISVGGALRLMDGGPTCNAGIGPPCHRDQLPLPVEMGNSGAWFLGSACTLGFKACDIGTGSSVLVTNSHCAQYANGCALAALGDPVEHVGPLDQMPLGSGVEIGTISGHAAPSCGAGNNYTDATKVTSAFFQSAKTHRDIGTPKREISNPVPHWRVQYSGRSSGHNWGSLEAIHVTVKAPIAGGFCCGSLTMKDQIAFKPHYSVIGGDSGSGVLISGPGFPKYDNRIVGLLFAYDGDLAYANNIDRVLSALNLTLDFTRCGFPSDY